MSVIGHIKYKLDLVGINAVRWDKGGTELADYHVLC